VACSGCLQHYSKLEFLYTVSHSAESVLSPLETDEIVSDLSDNKSYDEDSDTSVTVNAATVTWESHICVVCLNSERQPIALVPCRHSVMCSQ
jgi:hypothetical protein